MHTFVNLDQFRASRAFTEAKKILGERKKEGGNHLAGYHSLIITNGLLTTLAYSADKGGECLAIALALLNHIVLMRRKGYLPGKDFSGTLSLSQVLQHFADNCTPSVLAVYTDECMAYLTYLKRFVRALEVKEKQV